MSKNLPNYFIATLAAVLAKGGSESEVFISSLMTFDGQTVDITSWAQENSVGTLIVDPQSSATVEYIKFTAIDGSGIGFTGITRGLSSLGDGVSIAANKRFHPVGATVIIGFSSYDLQNFMDLYSAQTVAGIKTFTSSPVIPTGGTGTQAANATDIANAITQVSGTATNLVYGTTKLSVPAASPTVPIVVGDNDTRVPTAGQAAALPGNNTDIAVGSGNKFITQTGLIHGAEKYATTTGSANAYVAALSPVPTSLTNGMTITLIANFTNTGAATLAVNGLGSTPAITKNGTTALASGDIVSGQAFIVTWDGTRWQLQTSPANAPLVAPASAVSPYTTTSSTSAQNIDTAVTTPFTPKTITVYYSMKGFTSGGGTTVYGTGMAIFNGATIVGTYAIYDNIQAVTLTANTNVPVMQATAPVIGATGAGNLQVTLSITAVSATGFTVRMAYAGGGGPTALGNFIAVANA